MVTTDYKNGTVYVLEGGIKLAALVADKLTTFVTINLAALVALDVIVGMRQWSHNVKSIGTMFA